MPCHPDRVRRNYAAKKDPLAGLVSHSQRRRVVLTMTNGAQQMPPCGCNVASWCDKHKPRFFEGVMKVKATNG